MEHAIPLLQHDQTRQTLCALGHSSRFIALDGAQPVLAVKRIGMWMVSRGPVFTGEPDPAIYRILRENGVRVVNPMQADPRPVGYRQIVTPATLASLPLSTSTTMRDRMQQKWRNRLNRAVAQGIDTSEAPFDPHHHGWLLDHDRQAQRLKRYRSFPEPFTLTYSALFPEQSRIFIAWSGKSPIAAMLFLLHGSTATYHIAWSGPEGRAANAHTILMWCAMLSLAGRGISAIDLGLIDTEAGADLARFKLGTGAVPVRTGGTWISLSPFC